MARPLPASNTHGVFQTGYQSSGGHLSPVVPSNGLRPCTARALLGPRRAPAGPARFHHWPPGGLRRPPGRSALLHPPPGVLPRLPGEQQPQKKLHREGAPARGPGPHRARRTTQRARTTSRLGRAAPAHTVTAQLCRELPQKVGSRLQRAQRPLGP
ncbi:hypothetical protein NDU88_004531 [Pleurodeles waltl]|uniref:Uncharacterized protein n=1 Tax=Pleurodeles waltl TaxID=8319 RepID=A0AAV7NJY1_PLEWA|nr:hypothetical protein NDU88_004531 [Pleurodeles waltl]